MSGTIKTGPNQCDDSKSWSLDEKNRWLLLMWIVWEWNSENQSGFTLSLQERKFEGGSSQISECMALELGERVKLESPVYSIDQTGQMVLVKTLDNQTYSVRPPGCSPSLMDVLRTESQHLMSAHGGNIRCGASFFVTCSQLRTSENHIL